MDSVPADRILVLVPHEPNDDPRVGWVTELCRGVAETHVLGATYSTELQAREFDGRVYVERVNILETASPSLVRRAARRARWNLRPEVASYIAGHGRLQGTISRSARARHQVASVLRHYANNASYALLTDSLHRRGRAISVAPRVIVCHDIFALAAGVRLKRQFGSRLIYDSHEFWPEADLIAQRWQERRVAAQEARLIRDADVVITVTPQLAVQLEELYGLRGVLSVPNAAPFEPSVKPSYERRHRGPIRFLAQGRVAPRRGYDELLTAWRSVTDEDARLLIRCPPHPYVDELRARHADLLVGGRVSFLDAVREENLVEGATDGDVGLIVYPAETRAHLHACPNKLSQFMHAGLAILANELPFVTDTVERAQCGLSFRINEPATLRDAVHRLVANPAQLDRMKRNARRAGEEWFNWERQSTPYREALTRSLAVARG